MVTHVFPSGVEVAVYVVPAPTPGGFSQLMVDDMCPLDAVTLAGMSKVLQAEAR